MAKQSSAARPRAPPALWRCVPPPSSELGCAGGGSGLCPTSLCVSDYSDSTEVKFEELKNVKLEEEEEEEEEEQEAAALDLSVNPASLGGRLVFSGSKKSSASLGSGSSRDSVSSDSEASEPLSCQGQGQTGVLTVHSYARGDGRVTVGEPCTRKKGSASRGISERELAEVWAQGTGTGRGCPGGSWFWGWAAAGSQVAGETLGVDLQSAAVSRKSQEALAPFPMCPHVTVVPKNCFKPQRPQQIFSRVGRLLRPSLPLRHKGWSGCGCSPGG